MYGIALAGIMSNYFWPLSNYGFDIVDTNKVSLKAIDMDLWTKWNGI